MKKIVFDLTNIEHINMLRLFLLHATKGHNIAVVYYKGYCEVYHESLFSLEYNELMNKFNNGAIKAIGFMDDNIRNDMLQKRVLN